MELTGAAHSLARVLENKIRTRLAEIPKLREQAFKQLEADFPGKTRKELGLIWMKQNELPAYRTLQRLSGEVKQLNRSLGGLLTTNPEFYADEGLFDDILKYDLDSSELAARLKEFGGKTADYGRKYKGKVGHHGTALSTLREFLKNKDPSWRREFLKIAQAEGYEIGEEFIKYIDPAAHKAFSKRITGILGKRGLNPKNNKAIFEALESRFAHAWWSGSSFPFEKGFAAAPELANTNPAQAFKNVLPNLEIDKLGTDYALQLDDIINKWDKTVFPPGVDPAKELLKRIEKLEVPDRFAANIIKAGSDINLQEGLIDATGKKLTSQKDIMNIFDEKFAEHFASNSKTHGFLKRWGTRGAFTNLLTNTGKAFGQQIDRGINIVDRALPSEETVNIYKEEGLKSAAPSYAKDIAFKSTVYGTSRMVLGKALTFAPGFLQKGAASFFSGPPGWILGAGLTLNEIDNIFGGPTKKRIVQAHKDWQPYSEKRIKEMGLADISEYNLPRGPAEIKQWNPTLLEKTKMRVGDFFNRY